MRTATFLAFALATLTASFVAADDTPAPTQEFVFTDELVDGDLMHPEGEIIRVRERVGRRSLIRPRYAFVAEMLKSTESL